MELDELAGPDGGDESRSLAKHWLDQLDGIKDNSAQKSWLKRGEAIEQRYRDERTRSGSEGARRYSSLWSNVQVLKPALYAQTPLPIAERRFKDKDPVGRAAAEILERALRNHIEINGYHEALAQAVSDYLLPGRGTVWVRYEPEIEQSASLPPDQQVDMRNDQDQTFGEEAAELEPDEADEAEFETTPGGRQRRMLPPEPEMQGEGEFEDALPADTAVEKLQDTGDRVIRESVPVDYVSWKDFFTIPIRARTWTEVTAVAKRVYMSRDQMIKRFGKKIGKAIPLRKDDRGDKTQNTTLQGGDEEKGIILEIWNRDDATVYWIAQGYDYLCDRRDDPLQLENFWPCPRPLYANGTNNTLIPVPDYIQYQDQAIQIDELTQRLAMLTKALKVAGVYNAQAKDIQRLLSESVENELIPVDDWAAFAEKGGVEGNISLLPVQQIIGVINELTGVKQQQIEEMDRLTGINDIMRGTSDARETLGGVRLKSNNTGTRLQQRQDEVARFARDVVKIMADIMSQHFSPQSLIESSGAMYAEGLAADEMPSLTQFQSGGTPSPPTPQAPAMPPPVPPALPGPPIPTPGAPPPMGMPPGAPPAPPMGAPPMGGNVVPFRPLGAPPAPAGPMAGHPPMGGPPMGLPGMPPPPDPEAAKRARAIQRIIQAIQLLRDERLRGFRVDIEVDSTIYGDVAAQAEQRTQFVATVTGYIEKAAMLGGQFPEAIPLLCKLLQFGIRGQGVGRDMEIAIEDFCDEAVIKAKKMEQDRASQPNPEQLKMQTEMMKAKSTMEAEQLRSKTDMTRAQFDMQQAQLEAQSEQQSTQADIQRQHVENVGEQANVQGELEMKRMEMDMRREEMVIEKLRLQIEMAKVEAEARKPSPQAAAPKQPF